MTPSSALDAHQGSLLESAVGRDRSHELTRRITIGLGRALVLAFLLGAWTLASGRWIDSRFVSSPLPVLGSLLEMVVSGRLWPHLLQTLIEVSVGYVIGAVGAVTVALMVGLSDSAQRVLRPFLTALYAIPKVAVAPLIIMWFGLGISPKIFLAAGFVFFVVFMNTVAGIQNVNPHHVDVARVMGAGRVAVLWKVILPSAVPFLMTGLRLAIPEALMGAVIGEFLAANRGLGYLVNSAATELNMSVSLAAILVLLILVALIDLGVVFLENHLMRWRPRATAGSPTTW